MHQRSWLAVKPIRKATRRQSRRRCWDVLCQQEKKWSTPIKYMEITNCQE